MLSYEETMRQGAAEYADALAALQQVGVRAGFTQTGGMNAALEARLESGGYLLVTAAEDSLPWTRTDRHGWGAGVYPSKDDQDHLAYDCTPQGGTEDLVELVRGVMRAARTRRPGEGGRT